MTDTNEKRPVSPVNGQPLPRGKPFGTGDERARNAGKLSGKSRKERKTLREELLAVLTSMEIPQKDTGKKIPVQEALSISMVNAALKGNVRAYEIIRDTIGEKPAENLNIVTSDFTALDEAFARLEGDGE